MNLYILDEHDVPVEEPDVLKWARWFEQTGRRIVSRTEIGNVRVSTVFLGVDHDFFGQGPPILFETMIFGGPLDQEQRRYSYMDEARAGHEEMVALVRMEISMTGGRPGN